MNLVRLRRYSWGEHDIWELISSNSLTPESIGLPKSVLQPSLTTRSHRTTSTSTDCGCTTLMKERARPVHLSLLHGEPVWSYMYRDAIQGLAAAGYRVIAPDNIGFGKSDKVIDVEWYTLDHHVLTLKTLVRRLDLRGISIVVNDWGGPNGLIMATEMPDRFDRLIILNTWLHHEGYGYTDALREWNIASQSIDFTTGLSSGTPKPAARNYPHAVLAPFDTPDSTAGPLRWPWMLPFAQPEEGNARRQTAAFDALGVLGEAGTRHLWRL